MIQIRHASVSDGLKIKDLMWQLGYDSSVKKISDNLDDGIFVATLNGEVVGMMSLIFFEYFPTLQKICRITSIVVNENERGSGIGTLLVEHAKKQALLLSCDGLEVTTSLLRTKTQHYYENIGFEKSSFRYYQKLKSEMSLD